LRPRAVRLRGQRLLARFVLGAAALALFALAFVFLTVAIAAAVALAAGLAARIWWVRRRMAKAAERSLVAAEYVVIEREAAAIAPARGAPEHESARAEREP
jgi:hypothetical protein